MKRSIAGLLIGLFVLTGCDIDAVRDATDNFDLIIQLEEIETYAIGNILDAETDEPVTATVEVTFEGDDASLLIDYYSDPVSSMSVKGGFFGVGVSAGVHASPQAPVRVNVLARANGYEDAIVPLVITSAGENSFDLYLTPRNRTVTGTARQEVVQNSVDGRVEATAVETAPEQTSGASARVEIDAQNRLLDADGRALSGQIRTSLSYYSPRASASLAAFPGGFNAPQVEDDRGKRSAGIMTAGFVNVGATGADGRAAARFENPVRHVIELPESGTNPVTKAPYAAGDELSVLHFDAQRGVWKAIATAKVDAAAGKASGTNTVAFSSTATGFHAVGSLTDACEGWDLVVQRNGHRGSIVVTVTGEDGGFRRRVDIPAGKDRVTLSGMPDGAAFGLDIRTPDGEVVTQRVTPACGGVEVVSLPAPTSQPTDVLVTVDFSCTLRLQPPFNATLKYKRVGEPGAGVTAGTPDWRVDEHGRVVGGSLEVPGMYLNQNYRVTLITPEDTESRDVFIDSADFFYDVDVPGDLCRR